MSQSLYVGIDLGGTNIKGVLVDTQARTLAHASTPTEVEGGPDHVIARMASLAERVIAEADVDADRVAAVGVGSPGFMDTRAGVVIAPPNLPGWRDVPLRERMKELTGKPVTLVNDANAAAWGEFWVGAGRDAEDLAMFTLGTGIGGGVIVGGSLVVGAADAGGELGHMTLVAGGRRCGCGNLGCLEAYASATATVARFEEAVSDGAESTLAAVVREGGPVTARMIHEHALEGDVLARRTLEETGRFLGIGICNVMVTTNPDCVVLAGGMIAAGDLLMDAVRGEVAARLIPHVVARTRIVFAELGNLAGAIGAAGCALNEYETSA